MISFTYVVYIFRQIGGILNGLQKKPNVTLVKEVFGNKTVEEIQYYNVRQQINGLEVTDGIRGFKNYRHLALTGRGIDADHEELVMSIFCLLLEKNANVNSVEGYESRRIHYIDKHERKLIAETDTIHSLQTDLNEFFRDIVTLRFHEKIHHLYSRGAGIRNKEIVGKDFSTTKLPVIGKHREHWLFTYVDEIFYSNNEAHPNKRYDETIYQLLEKWANLVHTFGNFMLGPEGFNASSKTMKPKSAYGDQLHTFLKAVKEKQEYMIGSVNWQEQLQLLMETNYIDLYFVGNKFTSWDEVEIIDIPSKKEHLEQRARRVVQLIEERGEIIAREIKQVVQELKEN